MKRPTKNSIAGLLLSCALLGSGAAAETAETAEPGSPGGPGLALLAAKVLTCELEGPGYVDRGVVLVRDGVIEAVGRRGELAVPEDYQVIDVGEAWLSPGIIDLHTHTAGASLYRVNDLNDTVYLTNPGLRASAAVSPGIGTLRTATGGGVTGQLYIPGSGANITGQGVLVYTGFDTYADTVIRDPGSMKLAQAGNPEGFAWGVGRAFMNWNTRDTCKRGLAYAAAWLERERAGVEQPVRDPQWDVFHHLLAKTTQISVHTQIYQVVLSTITMLRGELGMEVYIDHGTIGAWRAGALAEKYGVPAIVGPRSVDTAARGMMNWAASTDEGFRGVAAGYQQQGLKLIGFNTDAPIVPAEEVSLQAAMAVRYGFDNSEMAALRGLTIIPAITAGIADRTGSLEPGKQADILMVTGDPADPRTSVERVWIGGRTVYDPSVERRRW